MDGEAEGVTQRAAVARRSAVPDEPATEEDVEHFKQTILNKLTLMVGKDATTATDRDWFVATTLSLRDRVIHRWLQSRDTQNSLQNKCP